MKTNILWISDIHLLINEYEHTDQKIKHYIDSFIKKVEEKVNNDKINLKYCIISGDLVQRGDKESFTLFKNIIIKEIIKISPSIKFLIIPGNHDINWGTIKKNEDEEDFNFLKEFIEKRKKEHNSETLQFLKNKLKRFVANFINYTDFTKDCKTDNLTKDNFSYHEEISYNDTNGLYGIVVDHESKIIFSLLNTAWFSFGDTFIDYLKSYLNISTEKYKGKEDKVERNKVIEDTLEALSLLSEYGNQRVYADLISKHLAEITQEHFDYLVLTTMHHPLNWIKEDEKYKFDINNFNFKALNSVLDKTDILLTGHEHLDKDTKINMLNNDIIHLQAGKLLNINETLLNNRFSFITIDHHNSNKMMTEEIYHTEPSKNNDKFYDWNEEKIERNKKLDKYNNREDIPNEIRKKILNDNFKNCIDSYIKEKLLLNKNDTVEEVKKYGNEIIILKTTDEKNLFIGCFCDDYFNNIDVVKNLNMHINESKIEQLFFIGIDLNFGYRQFYNNNYIKNRALNYETLLEKKADPDFNTFRNSFFSTNYEPNPETAITNVLRMTENIKNIKFINHVLPYWKAEYFIKNKMP